MVNLIPRSPFPVPHSPFTVPLFKYSPEKIQFTYLLVHKLLNNNFFKYFKIYCAWSLQNITSKVRHIFYSHIYSIFFRIHAFQAPGFLGSRFFRVQVFQCPDLSGSRFLRVRVQVFQGPDPGSRPRFQKQPLFNTTYFVFIEFQQTKHKNAF